MNHDRPWSARRLLEQEIEAWTRAAWTAALMTTPGGAAPPRSRVRPRVEAPAPQDPAGRSVGPANMGGRISDLAVDEKKTSTFYVATATGGLFKTTNAGTTWSPLFDKQAVA
jgi:hypothetical protein